MASWIDKIIGSHSDRELKKIMTSKVYPRNAANNMLTRMDTTQIRGISTVTNYMSNDPMRLGKSGYMVSACGGTAARRCRSILAVNQVLTLKPLVQMYQTLSSKLLRIRQLSMSVCSRPW